MILYMFDNDKIERGCKKREQERIEWINIIYEGKEKEQVGFDCDSS
jgi:predicted Fe-S protein YdhL (DUF1289 family)